MRAWVGRDMKALKAITAKDFILLMGSKPPAILDRPSWLEEAVRKKSTHLPSWRAAFSPDERWLAVGGYNHDVLLLDGKSYQLKATMDGRDWSGHFWVTDLWRKGRVRRGWKLAQRIVTRVDDNAELPKAIRALQLWK